MKYFINLLSTLVRRFPISVMIGALVLTFAFGYFTQFQETASGNEGFSPDSPEYLAALTIEDEFQENSTTFVQIVVSSEEGDVITAEGVNFDVELEGGRPDKFQANLIYGIDTWNWWTTRQWGAWEDKIDIGPVDEWRVYAIEWRPDSIQWFVDGKLVKALHQSDLDCQPECVPPQSLPTERGAPTTTRRSSSTKSPDCWSPWPWWIAARFGCF